MSQASDTLFYDKRAVHYLLEMIETDALDILRQLPVLKAKVDSSRNDSEISESLIFASRMLDGLRVLDMR